MEMDEPPKSELEQYLGKRNKREIYELSRLIEENDGKYH